ncbi:hypothetical protein Rhe02_55120 [Rhizocola hellebori]|uniref:Uncharacterized protein n=1 Tax=Rhizocola hellebori TaxID=1392758 RepID=A0A8J3QD38_9ACTN|nr:hypothetical protein [Rhizocola hellebori]GIH07445.1 hypothetical protein Rhe02_55120 [Rhizocola hellebori]
MDLQERIDAALHIADMYGQADGEHHKTWAIDQMVRALTDCPEVEKEDFDYLGEAYTYTAYGESGEYQRFVAAHNDGQDGPDTYSWDVGIAP